MLLKKIHILKIWLYSIKSRFINERFNRIPATRSRYIRIYSFNKDYSTDNLSRQELLPSRLNTVSIWKCLQRRYFPIDKYKNLKALILDAAMGLKPETYMDKVDVIKENLFTELNHLNLLI